MLLTALFTVESPALFSDDVPRLGVSVWIQSNSGYDDDSVELNGSPLEPFNGSKQFEFSRYSLQDQVTQSGSGSAEVSTQIDDTSITAIMSATAQSTGTINPPPFDAVGAAALAEVSDTYWFYVPSAVSFRITWTASNKYSGYGGIRLGRSPLDVASEGGLEPVGSLSGVLQPGHYYYSALIGAGDHLWFGPGSGSASLSATFKMQPLPPSDLAADFAGTVPTALRHGDSFSPTLKLQNVGSDQLQGTQNTQYFFSTTPDLSGKLIPAVYSDGSSIDLATGDSLSETPSLTVPADIRFGQYYLVSQTTTDLYYVDPQSGAHVAIDESDAANDTNNIAVAGPIKITASDLTGEFTVVPKAILKGDVLGGMDLPLSMTIHNNAVVAADLGGPLDVQYFLSTDQVWDESDLRLDATPTAAELADFHLDAGASTDWVETVKIPYNNSLAVAKPYYILAKIDANNQIEETNDDNNEALPPMASVLVPKVVNVVIHGFGSTLLFGPDFYKTWDGIAADLQYGLFGDPSTGKGGYEIPQGTVLYRNIVSYAPHWSSVDGWAEIFVGKLLQLAKFGNLPAEFDKLNPLIQQGLSIARAHADDAATATVGHLLLSQMLVDPSRTNPDDPNRQIIHLIGHSRGGAVAARVAQLLEDRRYHVAEYTALDGYGTDWPGISATFGDLDIGQAVPADIPLRENFMVQEPISAVLLTAPDQALEQWLADKAGKSVADVLPTPETLSAMVDLMTDWKSPFRAGFINETVQGNPGDPSNHINIGTYYDDNLLRYTSRTFETMNLNTPIPAGSNAPTLAASGDSQPITAMDATPSDAVGSNGDFLDGSFEALGAAITGVEAIDPSEVNDPFFSTWLSLVQNPDYLLIMEWDVTGDAHAVTGNVNTAVQLHFDGSNVPSIAQTFIVPPSDPIIPEYVDVDVHVVSGAAGGELKLNDLCVPLSGDGHYSIPLSELGGGDAPVTVSLGLSGPAGQAGTIQVDNLAVVSRIAFAAEDTATSTMHVTFDGSGAPISLIVSSHGDRLATTRAADGSYLFDVFRGTPAALIVDGTTGDDTLNYAWPDTVTTSINGGGGEDALNISTGMVATASTLKLSSLTIGGGGRLDLRSSALVIDASSVGTWNGLAYAGITGMVQSGRNGGDWSGSGIVTSSASGNVTTLGVAEAAQVLGISGTQTGLFAGETVDATTVLVKYTYGGDANLDGKINVDDYGRIDFNVGLGSTGWYNGDFNYDGKINVDDYGIIDFNVGIQGPPLGSEAVGGAAAMGVSLNRPAVGVAMALGATRRDKDWIDALLAG